MPTYRIDWTHHEVGVAYVEADSESAARQCYVDWEYDRNEVHTETWEAEQVREVVRREVDQDGVVRDIFPEDDDEEE